LLNFYVDLRLKTIAQDKFIHPTFTWE